MAQGIVYLLVTSLIGAIVFVVASGLAATLRRLR
jgi:hypothetical protein